MKFALPLAALCGAVVLTTLSIAGPQSAPKKLRVGTYDNRAIAIAYAASSKNPVAQKMSEMQKAKAASDSKAIAELEAWGEKHQRQMHRQGFGRVPVADLLETVKAQLPAAAAKAGVDVIAFECNYNSEAVEVVDVTDALVALFEPSERTLRFVADIEHNAPLDLDEIEQHKD